MLTCACGWSPQVAERTGSHVGIVKNVIIWGNHSSTQYPDVNHGTVGGKPIRSAVNDDTWLNGDFITTVQQRGAAIIKVGGAGGWEGVRGKDHAQPMLHGRGSSLERGWQV